MKRTVNGINLAFDDLGEGIPVVLVHAFPLNRRMWGEQLPALQDEFRLIAVDLRGFGESEAVHDIYTVDQMADDIHALLSEVSVKGAVLVGLSMGGYASLAFLRRYPEAVLGLVLADTRAAADSAEARAKRLKSAARAESEGSDGIVSEMLPLLIGNRSAQQHPALVARVRELALSTSPATIAAAQRGMAARPDSTALVSGINKPTLVVSGSDDVITTADEMEKMQHLIPDSILHRIEGAGHLSNMERPGEFNEAVLTFLRTFR